MKRTKNKFEKMSDIFWKIWGCIVIICHIIFIFSLIGSFIGCSSRYNVWLVLMIFSWILSGLFATIEDELERIYDRKHTEQFKIENSFLGECVFEKKQDGIFMELVDAKKKRRFGAHSVDIKYRGNKEFIQNALEKLEELFERADNILEQIYEAAFEQCQIWEEVDAYGIPIDNDFVRKFCSLGEIIVTAKDNKNISIKFISTVLDQKGNLLLGDHDIVMEIDCNTEEISFGFEG